MTLPLNGGIGIATTTAGDSSPQPVSYFADLLRSAAESEWASSRSKLEQQLKDLLGQGDLIHSGFTLYDIALHISPDLSYSIERTSPGDLVISITTGGNYVEATSTQPTAAGSWADPRVSVAFGLTFSYVVEIPPLTGPVSATGFSNARVLDPQADSHNLIADIGFLLNDLIDFFGGPNLIEAVERVISSMNFASVINGALTPLNAELDRLASAGYWFLDSVVDQLDGTSGSLHGLSLPGAPADRLDLLLIARSIDRSGILEGEIHWPSELGRPMHPGMFSDTISLARSATAVLLSTTRTDLTARLAAAPALQVPAGTPAPTAAPVVGTPGPALGSSLDTALTRLPDAERASAVAELRAGVASRFVALVGSDAARAALAEFANGRSDFTVQAATPVGGTGLFPDMKPVSRMAGLWADDDATTYRRRFRIVDVATGVPLSITAAVSQGLEWHGTTDQVAVVADHWQGTVTVTKGDPATHSTLVGEFATLRSATRASALAAARAGVEQVALNPQPLPPVEVQAELNPQPLPPVEVQAELNPQPLPPVENRFDITRTDGVSAFRRTIGRSLQGGRIGDRVDDVSQTVESAALGDLAHPTVENPTGTGIATDIDFTVKPFVAPIVR